MKHRKLLVIAIASASLLCACAPAIDSDTEVAQTELTVVESTSAIKRHDTALSRSPLVETSGYYTGELSGDVAKAYNEIVQQLISQYGAGAINPSSFDNMNIMQGTAVVRLLDFDNNGIPELYCTYASKTDFWADTQVLYTFADGTAKQVMAPGPISNPGTDVSPMTCFLFRDDRVYLVDSHEGKSYDYLTLENNEMVSAFHYEVRDDGTGGSVNGRNASYDEVEASWQGFEAGGRLESIGYYIVVEDVQLSRTNEVVERLKEGAQNR